jgi:hypothetical protein
LVRCGSLTPPALPCHPPQSQQTASPAWGTRVA